MADDLIGHTAGLDLARPAHHARNTVSTLPVGVLLVAERRHAAIGPAVYVRAVVGAVHDERVVSDAEVIELLEQLAHSLVVIDHRVVVGRLPATGLAQAFGFGVRAKVHVSCVEPYEKWLAGLMRAVDEVQRRGQELPLITCLHALLRQWTGILDATVGVCVHHAAWTVVFAEVGDAQTHPGVLIPRKFPIVCHRR